MNVIQINIRVAQRQLQYVNSSFITTSRFFFVGISRCVLFLFFSVLSPIGIATWKLATVALKSTNWSCVWYICWPAVVSWWKPVLNCFRCYQHQKKIQCLPNKLDFPEKFCLPITEFWNMNRPRRPRHPRRPFPRLPPRHVNPNDEEIIMYAPRYHRAFFSRQGFPRQRSRFTRLSRPRYLRRRLRPSLQRPRILGRPVISLRWWVIFNLMVGNWVPERTPVESVNIYLFNLI